MNLFGAASALGKEVKIDQERFKVVGVIENTPITRVHSYGDMFIPYTLAKGYGKTKDLTGEFIATLVARDKQSLQAMQQEYEAMMQHVELPDSFASAESHADPYLASFSRMMLGDSDSSGVQRVYVALGLLAFLFMLLPTVNLVNINISRIMERASEIGVRKAFGAPVRLLIIQFVFENMVLTLLSGLLAFVVAWLTLLAINQANIVQHMELAIMEKCSCWACSSPCSLDYSLA